MSFLITMRRFRWEMTSRFYKLLRGILECNLGEPLLPSPETIPIEILSRPALTVVSTLLLILFNRYID